MSAIAIREVRPGDYSQVAKLVELAFGDRGEAELVSSLRDHNDVVLELVGLIADVPVGHILFSRVKVTGDHASDAVALAPLAVLPDFQKQGVGSLLIKAAHQILADKAETLSFVLGDPAYYTKFGYDRQRAAGFESVYQGEYLQALAFADTPSAGTLHYSPAFGSL
ncbi:N-acetyltransferase [Phyllobacterium sp. YR531]|uniref:GNAT family N-acetyltransferase n=1 Tax=Phyllobacterium sp. YR531 TaxID=1144343 RepID=UPI00026F7E10|nr:N-acetyltransferase [Phyllobacterium sp. YR531]EJN05221.1 putative acetyltransferase [Phyllobacterium sp. YR531]